MASSSETPQSSNNRTMAKGSGFKSNTTTPLSEIVTAQMLPISHKLATYSLGEKCPAGQTQNTKDSLHSKIWRKCLKSNFFPFFTKQRVVITMCQAVAHFNARSTDAIEKIGHALCRHFLALGHTNQKAMDNMEGVFLQEEQVCCKLSVNKVRTMQERLLYASGAF
jgi:hypothetical protein